MIGEALRTDLPPRPPEDLKYRLTPRMRTVEGALAAEEGETLPHSLYRLYWEEKKSSLRIATDSSSSYVFVLKCLKQFEIPVRRSAPLRAAWEARRDSRIAKMHTPEADSQRSDTRKKFFEQHPEVREEMSQARREAAEASLKEKFGEDVKEQYEDLIRKGSTPRQIAEHFSYKTTGSALDLRTRLGITEQPAKYKPAPRPAYCDLADLVQDPSNQEVFESFPLSWQVILLGRAGLTYDNQIRRFSELGAQLGFSGEWARLRETDAVKILKSSTSL